MSTKMGFWRWALACAAVLIATGPAGAFVIDPTGVSTDEPTALVLYPRLKVDTNTCEATTPGGAKFCSLTPTVACTSNDDCNGCNTTLDKCRLNPNITCDSDSECPGAGVDTIVQLTNTSEFLTKVKCFYTNANSHCSNDPTTICTDENFRNVCKIGGLCVPGWVENDFRLTLTKRQPISWSVNTGLPVLPLATHPGQGTPPQFNDGNIPAVSEVPFTGELLCIEVDVATELPSDRNDFKGEATTIKTILSEIDANKYNAIGIKAIEGAMDDNPSVLNIGGPNAEYGVFDDQVNPPRFAGCPNVLTVDHFFDGANVVTHENELSGRVRSELTIVPCQRDYLHQTANGNITTIQFLIFNEFEQRFSTSTKLNCYKQVRLSDIDTQPGVAQDSFSIFSVGVQGTLTGMSRLRSVAGPDPNMTGYDGRTILAVLSENWDSGVCMAAPAQGSGPPITALQLCSSDSDCPGGAKGSCVLPAGTPPAPCSEPACTSTTTANVQFQGSREQGDQITIPLP